MIELGRGTDSVAYLLDGEWVFRFPLVANARETLRRETALLPQLGPRLPLPTPLFEHVSDDPPFVGYRLLRGEPLTAERFAGLARDTQEEVLASLAAFLEALHAFPVEFACRAGVREQHRPRPADVAHLLDPSELPGLERELERCEPDSAQALLHADLKPAHVLYDEDAGRLTGVIDWGDVRLGDPDFDLAVVRIFFGDDFLRRLLAQLPDRDPDRVLEKARFFATVRRLQDLAYDDARVPELRTR